MSYEHIHIIPELLAPAGGVDAFRAALAAGADAIYCGFGELNARRSAENFNEESFGACCREAHLAGVRVYVTVNVVIQADEMEQALALVKRAAELGADAFIVQDFGLIAEMGKRWPELEIHVSTQANIHNPKGVLWAASLPGVTRVTLSRELSLSEIAACCATGVPCESFAHGAICFCYSGLCLMSSSFGGRSANRGLCAQPCRLPYELLDEQGTKLDLQDRERLLCPRDMNVMPDLEQLVASSIASLKIEGRMKSPDYVFEVVSAYRTALDRIADKQGGAAPAKAADTAAPHETDQKLLDRQLKRAFNRDFTNAYLHGHAGNELMSYERSNNRGQVVGEVISSRQLPERTRFKQRSEGHGRTRHYRQAELMLKLSEPVGAHDLLEIRPSSDSSQFFTCSVKDAAQAGQTIRVVGVRTADAGSVVCLIRSQEALNHTHTALSRTYARKRPVLVQVRIRKGECASITLSTTDGGAQATAEGKLVEPARTKELSASELIEHVGRMGASPFEPVSFEVELDPRVGMSFSSLHALRSEACALLEAAILAPYTERAKRLASTDSPQLTKTREHGQTHKTPHPNTNMELCVMAATPEVAQLAHEQGARLYVPAYALDEYPHSAWPKPIVVVLDEVSRAADSERLMGYASQVHQLVALNVSEFAGLSAQVPHIELGPTVPVHNTSAVRALEAAGAQGFWLSPELSLEQIAAIAPAGTVPVGVVIAGRPRVMTSEHCVLQAIQNCSNDCVHCQLRTQHFSLKNIDGHLLPIRSDLQGRSRIYGATALDATPELGQLGAAGISRVMIDARLQTIEEFEATLAHVRAALDAYSSQKPLPARLKDCNAGHLYTGIG